MKRTCGIFFISADGLLLIGHPTNADMCTWSVPKGIAEFNEAYEDAATREFFEETGIIVDSLSLTSLTPIRYTHGNKYFHPFVYRSNLEHTKYNPVCDSMVVLENGNSFPENDLYKWVTFDEASTLLHYTQVSCLDLINN